MHETGKSSRERFSKHPSYSSTAVCCGIDDARLTAGYKIVKEKKGEETHKQQARNLEKNRRNLQAAAAGCNGTSRVSLNQAMLSAISFLLFDTAVPLLL